MGRGGLSGGLQEKGAGLDIATILVAFATKFSPFATENSSAVATLQPVFA